MVFKEGCDDWYLEEITIERIINDKMIWKSTCNYGLWLTYCYANALCKNGRAILERPWCDKLLLLVSAAIVFAFLITRHNVITLFWLSCSRRRYNLGLYYFGTSSGNAGCLRLKKTLVTETCIATWVLIWLGVLDIKQMLFWCSHKDFCYVAF